MTSVDKAADAGVAVVAYDRLIKSPKIAGYISFNNVEVGRQQADGVMKALDIENWDTAANGPARVVKLGGSPTDNNAILFRQGQDEIVNPLVEAGKVEIVADQWVENWDAANALKLMENILTGANNDVDAVVASNDGTALGALQALKAQGLAGKVPISGQDATADGCNSIVKGELTVSILKDIRNLAPIAVDMVGNLLNGEAGGRFAGLHVGRADPRRCHDRATSRRCSCRLSRSTRTTSSTCALRTASRATTMSSATSRKISARPSPDRS